MLGNAGRPGDAIEKLAPLGGVGLRPGRRATGGAAGRRVDNRRPRWRRFAGLRNLRIQRRRRSGPDRIQPVVLRIAGAPSDASGADFGDSRNEAKSRKSGGTPRACAAWRLAAIVGRRRLPHRSPHVR